MINVLFGMLGAVLGVVLFMCGFYAGAKVAEPPRVEAPQKLAPSAEETAQLEKERERLRAEQRAFHDLIGYSADVAYGRTAMPGEE